MKNDVTTRYDLNIYQNIFRLEFTDAKLYVLANTGGLVESAWQFLCNAINTQKCSRGAYTCYIYPQP